MVAVEENLDFLKSLLETTEIELGKLDLVPQIIQKNCDEVKMNTHALYWSLTHEYGKIYYTGIIEWLKKTIAFLEGINAQQTCSVDIERLYAQEIKPCIGCFSCWTTTPGVCIHQDAAPSILEKYIYADLVIWSAPLYFFGLPSQAKAFMDRLLPLNEPTIGKTEAGTSFHPMRYDLSKQKTVLISCCSFFYVKIIMKVWSNSLRL